jgi:hypothetical protein
MSYKSKYLKYKLKYLKLNLSLQKGGTTEHIEWPKDLKKIKIDDELKFISYKEFLELGNNDYTRLKSFLKKNPTGKVSSISEQNILVVFNRDDITRINFSLNQFPYGIVFEKNIPDTQKNNTNDQVIPLDNTNDQVIPLDKKNDQVIPLDNTNDQVIPLDKKNDQVIPLDKKNDQVIPLDLKEVRIIKLEAKIAEIEKRLTNHYHILPTSGMKDFEESHPYFNKKIN